MYRWPAFVLLGVALLGPTACDDPGPVNTAPTVTFTSGPDGVLVVDSARFSWRGFDADGNLAGFHVGLDDTMPGNWTVDTTLLVAGISLGPHVFYVRAEDDSGARSPAVARSFWVEYDSLFEPLGTDTTLEVATWNVQDFPRMGDSTVNRLRALMARLDLDIYALQEIADTLAFQRLLSTLPGYAGLYSRDDYGSFYLKTGVVYRTSVVSVSDVRQLFWGDVTRPLLEMTVRADNGSGTFDFKLVVMHLKAGGTSDDEAQRRTAIRLLKERIDEALAGTGEHEWVVVGDWNDRLDDPPQWNVFQPLLDDSLDYRFLTWPLRGSSVNASHIGSGSLIDHLMITTAVNDEYEGGRTMTLRLDDQLSTYPTLISDHRPVVSFFPVFRQ